MDTVLTQLCAFEYFQELRQDSRYQTVVTPDQFESMVRRLRDASIYAFDTETSGLSWWNKSRIVGVSFTIKENDQYQSWYVPFRHLTGESQLNEHVIKPAIGEILSQRDKLVLFWNEKFDRHMAAREGWSIEGIPYDGMIMARIHNENESASLKNRAAKELQEADAHKHESILDREIERLAGINGMGKQFYRDMFGYAQIPIHLCGLYAARDTEYTYRLIEKYQYIPKAYPRIFQTENRLTRILFDMEENGVPIDCQYLGALKQTLGNALQDFEKEIWNTFGTNSKFDLSSNDELHEFLVGTLKLKLWKQTKQKQAFAVDQEVLEELSEQVPALQHLLNWRTAQKLLNTYTDSLLERVDPKGLLHCDFRQQGTGTGRLSCCNPNTQNLPADDDDRAMKYSGKKLKQGGIDPWSIRRAFVTRPGHVRLFFDYSQIELRVLAKYTMDPVMVDAYVKGEDIHRRTSLEVFGTDEPHMRRTAKLANFGTSYGLSARGLSRKARISLAEAEEFYKAFHARYSGIPKFREMFWKDIRTTDGVFQNLFGRPRRISKINSTNSYERGSAERQAIGSLIQGQAAELTKESLVRIDEWAKREEVPLKLCLTVHDEIQMDALVEDFGRVASTVKYLMEAFPEFEPIPIIADIAFSTTNWADKKSVEGL